MIKIKNVPLERWNIAQKSEKEYWQGYDLQSLKREEINMHRKKTEVLEKEWRSFLNINKKTRILQIGCGPEDVINYISKGDRYAIDPLADFYKEKFNLNYNPVKFIQGKGEQLPFKNNFFDMVILANVLDHVESPQKVLIEIRRVLKKDGVFHFENTFYNKQFLFVSKIWAFLEKVLTKKTFNIHHPHMWKLEELRQMVFQNFIPSKEYVCREIIIYNGFKELCKKRLKSKKLSTRILAFFKLYGDINYIGIFRKKI